MWFFTADWHLNHANIIKYYRRDFASAEENSLLQLADRGVIPFSDVQIKHQNIEAMNEAIIENTNSVVKQNDSLVILGDFCWAKQPEILAKFRNRINCKNLYLIWGNHDRPQLISSIFKACYYQYLWTIDGQKIFTSHYPCRSWDRSQYGSWMLYGHCHNELWHEDNFQISSKDRLQLETNLLKCLNTTKLSDEEKRAIIENFLKQIVISQGLKLTLDVGVDNRRPNLSFGTPWSFEEIEIHMNKKREIWFSLH